jgi:hypothetical protein
MYQWVRTAAVRENRIDGIMVVIPALFALAIPFRAVNPTV